MKKLLNTLFVAKQNASLHKDGETVVVELDKQVLQRLPIHTLNGIVTFGNVMPSPYLLNFSTERGVCASMFGDHGKFIARVEGPVSATCCFGWRRSELMRTRAAKTAWCAGLISARR